MPVRKTPLVTNHYYHILNRSINSTPLFHDSTDYQRFLRTICFYQYSPLPYKFSNFLKLTSKSRHSILEKTRQQSQQINIIAYCLMPTHFHFLLKQNETDGIRQFITQITNSYSHYFNSRHNRHGSLFSGRFKSIKIKNNSQLLHLSRYIHLNPFSSNLTNQKNLLTYPHSSLPEYLGKDNSNLCHKKIILYQFSPPSSYQDFILNHADHQRQLQSIKHLLLDL